MTERQRIALQARWWPAACRRQGWPVGDRALRLRVCRWAISLKNPTQPDLLAAIQSPLPPPRPLATTSDLDHQSDIDAVKACLGMLADDLRQTREVGQPQFGRARRKRDAIRAHLQCLALYETDPHRFLAALVADLFNHGRPGLTLRDLTDDPHPALAGPERPSDLDRLLMRLAAIVNQKRNANRLVPACAHLQGAEPLTIHEMKIAAGVSCTCARCRTPRAGFGTENENGDPF